MSNTYGPIYKTSRELKITIPAQDLTNTLLDEIITEIVEKKVSGQHDGYGIVIPGTVKIVTRSPLYQDTLRFGGEYACHIKYVADCFDAPKGMKTTAIVRLVLPNGILCETERPELKTPVFRVFLPYALHDESTRETMRTLLRDQEIKFRSVQRYGGMDDTTIDVLGQFLEITDKTTSQNTQPTQFMAPIGPDTDDIGVIAASNPEDIVASAAAMASASGMSK
jgi:hypothetical protein